MLMRELQVADDFCKMQCHHPQKPSRQMTNPTITAPGFVQQCAGPGTGCREIDLGCFRALCLSNVDNNQGRAQNILVHNHAIFNHYSEIPPEP